MELIMTEEQKSRYPEGWNPFEWHDAVDRFGRVRGPRWRIKADKFHERDRLCLEFDRLNVRMALGSFSLLKTMSDLGSWDGLKEAILACEEREDGSDPVTGWRNRWSK